MTPLPCEQVAFKMYLNKGCRDEYQRRHDAIWPELVGLLKAAGVSDYTIYLDEEHGELYATLKRSASATTAALPAHPVMRRWWANMADLLRCDVDGKPVTTPLPRLFHLD
jgi:L-rhamnose mutarotase